MTNDNNYKVIYHFPKDRTEELVFAFSEFKDQPRVDIRFCKAAVGEPDDLILTQKGINFHRDLLPQIREAVEKIAEIFSTNKVVATIPVGKREIRVGVNEFKGHVLVYVRYFYKDKKSGEMRPDKKGISIKIESYPNLLKGFVELERANANSGEEKKAPAPAKEKETEPPKEKEEHTETQETDPPEEVKPPVKEVSKKDLGGDEPPVPVTKELEEKTIIIEHNSQGYSYQNLFGPYLKTAKSIKVEDPYIIFDYQIRNFMDFITIIPTSSEKKKLKLVTSAHDEVEYDKLQSVFQQMTEDLDLKNIDFTYRIDNTGIIHDRYMELDNGWIIEMGRGLDIFQRPAHLSLAMHDQEFRMCKATRITFKKIH